MPTPYQARKRHRKEKIPRTNERQPHRLGNPRTTEPTTNAASGTVAVIDMLKRIKSRPLLVVTGCVVAVGLGFVALVSLTDHSEPSWNGIGIRQWLTMLDGGSDTERVRATDAIRAIGGDAQDYLSRELDARDLPFDAQLRRVKWIHDRPNSQTRRRRALRGYLVLEGVVQPSPLAESKNFRAAWDELLSLKSRYLWRHPKMIAGIERAARLADVRTRRN